MKLKVYRPYGEDEFTIRDESGHNMAREVTPELAAWIVAANAALENHGWPYRECERVAVEFGPALTEGCDIEI